MKTAAALQFLRRNAQWLSVCSPYFTHALRTQNASGKLAKSGSGHKFSKDICMVQQNHRAVNGQLTLFAFTESRKVGAY